MKPRTITNSLDAALVWSAIVTGSVAVGGVIGKLVYEIIACEFLRLVVAYANNHS